MDLMQLGMTVMAVALFMAAGLVGDQKPIVALFLAYASGVLMGAQL